MRIVRELFANVVRAFRTSLRYRLVLLTALTIVLAAALSGVGTYQAARVSLYDQLDIELLSIADRTKQDISSDIADSTVAGPTSQDPENVLAVLVGANTNVQTVFGDPTTTLVIEAPEVAIARIQTGSSARDGESTAGMRYRIVAVPLVDGATNDAYSLVIARDLTPTVSGLASLATLQWVIAALAILVCTIAAVFVANATLNPIRQLTSVVSGVTSADELTTIEVRGATEVAELERSFNLMMQSLAASRTQQNRLIADAGHELRTPLTSLRTNIELLLADDKAQMLPDSARSEILSDVAAQLGEFTSLVNDLVVLSRGDAAPRNPILTDFSDVVSRAVARAQRRGPSMVFDVELAPVYVMGDAVSLERAVTNLLDNSVKFSPPGSRITVRLDGGGLTVTDEGPGIADEDAPHVFERFYRSDSSRNTPGTGLGLSIVDHTVTAHGGTVEVGRAPSGGARFVVRIPEVIPDETE
ncbi:MAG: HAMP domain-containing histidine kinase [Propionibacteriaceae bacterium]|jgi:two-component system sensor histidine kinase MprB|nr:HAMP domain-containing histidine kinase [Propionibacteriaceae bacterium]